MNADIQGLFDLHGSGGLLTTLIQPIWFSTKRPENHSIKFDENPNMYKVVGAKGWESQDVPKVVSDVRDIMFSLVYDICKRVNKTEDQAEMIEHMMNTKDNYQKTEQDFYKNKINEFMTLLEKRMVEIDKK